MSSCDLVKNVLLNMVASHSTLSVKLTLKVFFLSGVKLCDVYNAALEHVAKEKPDFQANFVKNVG